MLWLSGQFGCCPWCREKPYSWSSSGRYSHSCRMTPWREGRMVESCRMVCKPASCFLVRPQATIVGPKLRPSIFPDFTTHTPWAVSKTLYTSEGVEIFCSLNALTVTQELHFAGSYCASVGQWGFGSDVTSCFIVGLIHHTIRLILYIQCLHHASWLLSHPPTACFITQTSLQN